MATRWRPPFSHPDVTEGWTLIQKQEGVRGGICEDLSSLIIGFYSYNSDFATTLDIESPICGLVPHLNVQWILTKLGKNNWIAYSIGKGGYIGK